MPERHADREQRSGGRPGQRVPALGRRVGARRPVVDTRDAQEVGRPAAFARHASPRPPTVGIRSASDAPEERAVGVDVLGSVRRAEGECRRRHWRRRHWRSPCRTFTSEPLFVSPPTHSAMTRAPAIAPKSAAFWEPRRWTSALPPSTTRPTPRMTTLERRARTGRASGHAARVIGSRIDDIGPPS